MSSYLQPRISSTTNVSELGYLFRHRRQQQRQRFRTAHIIGGAAAPGRARRDSPRHLRGRDGGRDAAGREG
jgi:hypothetical protein